MADLKKENYSKILIILTILILLSAFSIQYIFGYQPCNLCLIERVPYILALIILLINLKSKKNDLFFSILLMLIFSFSILISLYHFGIEQGLIEESSVCASKNIELLTKDEILKSLQELRISCKDVTFRVFGLSLTAYNIIMSILMFLISFKIYLINNDNKK